MLKSWVSTLVFGEILQGCCAPVECGQAKAGFALYTPVIEALGRYRIDRGAYPEELAELVPSYLSEASRVAIDERLRDPAYRRSAGGYQLRFRYLGPGVNTCWYDSASRQWDCSGYY